MPGFRRRFDGTSDRYGALLRATTSIVWDMPRSGEFQRDQPEWERFTGQSPRQYRGMGWLNAVHPEDRAHTESAWRNAFEKGAQLDVEHRLFRRDGVWRAMRVVAVPITDAESGAIVEWVGSHADVTRHKQAEHSLRGALGKLELANRDLMQASDAKSVFLATMSHELRTPLNAMIGYSELLLLGLPQELPGALRPHIERIDLSARHLLQLIEEVLTFSRIEAGRERIYYELVQIPGIMREVRAIMEPLTAAKGLQFNIDITNDPIQLITDPRKIRQILVNLLGNATKFTAEGSITLRARSTDGWLKISVEDTGIGIAPDHMEKIFEPFWQVDHGKTRAIGGTGLGLAVTRELAVLLGGSVTVESTPGQGSTFTVLLPLDATRDEDDAKR